MESRNTTIDVLNDLISINIDRVAGYQHAIEELKQEEMGLKSVFDGFIADSMRYREELKNKVVELGGTPATDSTLAGKVYRLWMDTKATLTGNNKVTILASCEFGEDAAQKAYEEALATADKVYNDVLQLITEQKDALKKAHDTVKSYRDQEK